MLSITTTQSTMSTQGLTSANLVVSTDGALTTPPATYDILIRSTGLVPDRDFSIAGFAWTEVSEGVWDGTFEIGYDELTTLNPLIFQVEPIRASQIGDGIGVNFELLANTYTVDGGADNVDITLQGNSDDVILAEPFIKFDGQAVVGIKANAINLVVNNSGATQTINELFVVGNTDIFTVFYDNSGTWTEFINGVTTFSLASGATKKILVQVVGVTPLTLTSRVLRLGWTPAVSQFYSYWRFADNQEIIDVATGTENLTVEIQSFTWLDGSTIPATSSCPSVDLGSICGGCDTATATIEVLVTNIAAHGCVNGGAGQVRLGDAVHGWYPLLSNNDNGNVVITYPAVATDADYILMPNDSLTLTLTVTCSAVAGAHSAILNVLRKNCELETIATVSNYQNGAIIDQVVTPTPEAGTNDFFSLNPNVVIQGDGTNWSTVGSNSFTWAAHSVSESISARVFTAPANGDYTFLIDMCIPKAATSATREYGLFLNGVFESLIHSGVYPFTGQVAIELTLSLGDEISFGVFYDDIAAHVLYDALSISVYNQAFVDIPAVQLVCSPELTWFVRTDGVTVIPSTTISLETTTDVNAVQIVVVSNGSNEAIEVTEVTIDPGLASAGLSAYFPESAPLAVGQTKQIAFTFNPSVVLSNVTGVANIVLDCGDPIQVAFNLTSHGVSDACTITPSQAQYFVEANLGNSTLFENTVILNTNNNYGTLEITGGSGATYLTFGESPYGSPLMYKTFVNENQSLAVPVIVTHPGTVLPDPSVYNATINWVLRNESDVIICSGSLVLTYTLILASQPISPISFLSDLLAVYDLRPTDTGELIAYVDIDREPSEIGEFELTFSLPSGETVVEFQTQPAISGITWDETHIGDAHPYLVAAVDTEVFADQQIPVKLQYTIPSTVTQTPINSTLSLASVFDNPLFASGTLVANIYLSVLITGTGGGYETQARIATAVDCQTANVYDESNYGADANHDLADFTLFRKITLHKPDGTDYVMSTHAPYDELIQPASSNVLAYPVAVTSGGIYNVEILSVPTYNPAGTYLHDDTVVMLDGSTVKFFKSLVNSNTGNDPLSVGWESYWEQVEEADIEPTYSDVKYYVQWCDLNSCQRKLERTVFCQVKNLCENDLCKNKCYQALNRYKVVSRMLAEAESLQWHGKMTDLYNLAKQLCDCNNGCQ